MWPAEGRARRGRGMDSIGGARIAVDQFAAMPVDSIEDQLREIRRERDALRRENRIEDRRRRAGARVRARHANATVTPPLFPHRDSPPQGAVHTPRRPPPGMLPPPPPPPTSPPQQT